ncbi:hypothetical protein BASA81_010541 [Batrachochytrium salamandrivorans]|nr:hypothetical protein BASA81_010541 [Batrachochytrium salamandrivorans]
MQRFARLSSTAAVVAAAAGVASLAYSQDRKVALAEPTSSRIAAVFVQEEGRKALSALRSAYPSSLSSPEKAPIDLPKLVLAYSPIPDVTLAKVASQLSRPVDFRVLSLVSDEHLQVAVVEVAKHLQDDDGGLSPNVLPVNSILHIAIASKKEEKGDPRYSTEFYGHQLLARVLEHTPLDQAWTGTLPAQSGFDKTKAEVAPVSKVDAAQFVLHAMVCISDQWEKDKCGEPQCGFCRFMKLGPCGSEFEVWEACVAQHRDGEDGDFVEKCGQQTWAMKECVDKFPDYYMSVVEEDELVEDNLIEVSATPANVTLGTSAAVEIY